LVVAERFVVLIIHCIAGDYSFSVENLMADILAYSGEAAP
jgi:hypothetical protein